MRQIFTFILILASFFKVYSQVSISGVVNSYYKVNQVYNDSVVVDTATGLYPGDKVILMQMTGTKQTAPPPVTSDGFFSQSNNMGNYLMLAIKSVTGNTIRFSLGYSTTGLFTTTEKFQLIKIYEADHATVTGTLTAGDWDGEKGGVLALVIYKKLTLNANIDVSAKGFRGGVAETTTINCRPESAGNTYYFLEPITDSAGRKGEGNVEISKLIYTKGPGKWSNGGGGGLGKFAGGGGGSNAGQGGNGGIQSDECTTPPSPPSSWSARGGAAKDPTFTNAKRVTMGGGGGTSSQDGSHTATKGGDGGGIVIILTDTITANTNDTIISNGESVYATATAGAGGGGGGGSILLDINYYASHIQTKLKGGLGGSTVSAPFKGGGGGGGGGGLLWYASANPPPSKLHWTFAGGDGGNPIPATSPRRAGGGTIGDTVPLLVLPLHGFLFNSVYAIDTICEGLSPKYFIGSLPKGGASYYSYQWIKSTDSINWIKAGGPNSDTLVGYQSGSLSLTTWFTRVVKSGLVYDTAQPEMVWVWPAIVGNTLSNRDTICLGTSPGTLTGGSVSGGNNLYTYNWQSSINQISWTPRVTSPSFTEGNLNATTYYRRLVTSAKAVCNSTSNIDTITVLPLILNNEFVRADTAVCDGLSAGIIKTKSLTGGDQSYWYEWMVSDNGSTFATIAGAESEYYSPPTLTKDQYYKRTVYSGLDSVCSHTTNSAFKIYWYSALTSNSISTDSSRYCAGDIPNAFAGSVPGGGFGAGYSYRWLSRKIDESWDILPDTLRNYSPSTIYTDTVQIGRQVISGRYGACKDTSNLIQLDVIPYINNILITPDTAICENATPLPFNELPATGGANVYVYTWQAKNGNDWQNAEASNSSFNYSAPVLQSTTLFRRVVVSQICSSNNNEIAVTVYPQLENNLIVGGNLQYVCFNSSKAIIGGMPTQGNSGNYNYNWQESPDNNVWSNASGATNKDFNSPILTDTAFYRRIVLSGEWDQCIDTSESVLVRINSLPAGSIVSKSDTLCAGDQLMVDYALTGHSPWQVKLGKDESTNEVFSVSVPEGTIGYTMDQSALVKILEIADDSSCFAPANSISGLVLATVYEVPLANAGFNDSICSLEYALNAVPSVGNHLWTSENAAFDDPENPNATVRVAAQGTYGLIWAETNWQCSGSDTVFVKFFKEEDTVLAGEDINLNYTFETPLNATDPENGFGKWSSLNANVDIAEPYSDNSNVNFSTIGRYSLLWSIENGTCAIKVDSVIITIGDLIEYNAFSPNGDNVNDEFILDLSDRYESKLTIVDGWGGIVAEIVGKENISWDGKNSRNGKDMPEGTYYYILEEPGHTTRKGTIELRR